VPITWDITRFDELASTQDVAQQRLKDGAAEGVVIQCDRQPGGRGRFGTVWDGPLGNLYMSLILRPATHHQPGHYAFITSLSLVEAFRPLLKDDATLQVKWPNDVLLNDRKMAGILIEAQWSKAQVLDGMVIGIGVNIDAPPEGRACVNEGVAKALSVETARDRLLDRLAENIALYDRDGFSAIRAAWLDHAWNKGGEIKVRLANETLYGRFEDLTVDGALRLNGEAGVVDITSGEIVMDWTP
jgi:BirA family biotin operon repressor/biotin-[acetyl-CoA-carboxylase] ligase